MHAACSTLCTTLLATGKAARATVTHITPCSTRFQTKQVLGYSCGRQIVILQQKQSNCCDVSLPMTLERIIILGEWRVAPSTTCFLEHGVSLQGHAPHAYKHTRTHSTCTAHVIHRTCTHMHSHMHRTCHLHMYSHMHCTCHSHMYSHHMLAHNMGISFAVPLISVRVASHAMGPEQQTFCSLRIAPSIVEHAELFFMTSAVSPACKTRSSDNRNITLLFDVGLQGYGIPGLGFPAVSLAQNLVNHLHHVTHPNHSINAVGLALHRGGRPQPM